MGEAFSPFGINLLGEPAMQETDRGALSDRYIMPPLSVLRTDSTRWQERKRAWLAHGIRSEIGRDTALAYTHAGVIGDLTKWGPDADGQERGTSVFDPVLCELAYAWWCPAGGRVLDPFAGGSVRGIVAALMGRDYVGVELRAEQVAANMQQGAEITPARPPMWMHGDSRFIAGMVQGSFDFLLTCPPYADLERYSDDPRDLSTMDYGTFRDTLAEIMGQAFAMLRADTFAAVVVGDVRGPDGNYRGFPADVVNIARDYGLGYYNHAAIVARIGSTAVTAGNTFRYRKLTKQHQDLLVFVKGDARAAARKVGGGQ